MKNIYKYFFIIICLIMCSCTNTTRFSDDDTFHFETDAQYTFYNQGAERIFAESEEGYYFALKLQMGHYLFFTDKTTMNTIPLCNKPNCLHYAEQDEDKKLLCNAYFFGLGYEPSVFYNDGRLFVPIRDMGVGKDDRVLLEFTLDGSTRKEVLRFKRDLDACNMLFHRGYFYVAMNAYDEELGTVSQLLRYSLSDFSKKPECLYEVKGGEAGGIMDLIAYGNTLYFAVREEGLKDFYKMDLSNLEISQIFDIANGFDQSYNLKIFNNKLLYEMTHPNGDPNVDVQNLNATMYTASLDGENIQKWMDTKYTCYNSDMEYVYRWPVYAFEHPAEGHCLKIYDDQSNLLVEYSFMDELPKYHSVYVSLGEHVFITYGSHSSVYFFSKSEIESGEIHPKLLIDCSQYQ